MKNTSLVRSICCLAAALLAAALPSLQASDRALRPLADAPHAKALPVSTSFEKAPAGPHGGTHAVKVKNTGKQSLTITATIRQSVISHASAKTIELPAHTVAAGESWIIDDLAAEDKVSLAAEGYETLELKVPGSK